MRRNYKSLKLDEQDIISIIDTYQATGSLRAFIKRESINLSEEATEYAWKRVKELKRKEYKKYYKSTGNKYLAHIKTAKRKAKLESYLDLDLSETERQLVLDKLKAIGNKKPSQQTVRMKHYKYLDIIDKCNNVTTLQTYKTFTDLTKYELEVICKKINSLNKEAYVKQIEDSYIKRDVEQQIAYEKNKDKMLKDFLAKGGKIQYYDFGL